jgi:hypothetical protein
MIAMTTNLSLGWSLPPPQLAVLILTDKTSYTYRDKVEISGKLWLSGQPVDGLVAVEIINPNSQSLLVRTASIGTPATSGIIEIIGVTPCDSVGNPQNTFVRGQHAHVKVTIKNKDELYSHDVLVTVSTYDNDSTPILPEVSMLQGAIAPNGTMQFKPDIYVDSWVSTGSATFHANVYTDWPENGGYPYTTEKSATFNIVSTKGTASTSPVYQQPTISESNGFYNVTFRLPPNATYGAPFGNYTIHATAFSQGYVTHSTKTFSREFQLDADVSLVGTSYHRIDILDVVGVTSLYGAKSGDSNWNPQADVQPSGKIDILDVVIVTSKYGQKY